jgi:alcohol dehydrogenase (cytochrome c)
MHLRNDGDQFTGQSRHERGGMLAANPDARRGPRKTLTGVPCKTGIAWSFDAATGEFLWAKQTVEQNLVAKIDGKGTGVGQ